MFPLFKLAGALAAMSAPIAGDAPERQRQPIYLVAEPVVGGMRFQVIGASKLPFEGSFTLQVTGGGNQSRHRGSAELRGGEAVTLSTVTVGNANGEWRALLRVEPRSGEAYEQVRASS